MAAQINSVAVLSLKPLPTAVLVIHMFALSREGCADLREKFRGRIQVYWLAVAALTISCRCTAPKIAFAAFPVPEFSLICLDIFASR